MYKKMSRKGFTIIELIVVIAIIAILAAIVMVSVMQYIRKAKDATAKADMGQLANYATGYFIDHNNSYNGFFADSQVVSITNEINKIIPSDGSLTYNCDDGNCSSSNAQNWCAIIELNEPLSYSLWGGSVTASNYYCVDSSGNKFVTTPPDYLGEPGPCCQSSGVCSSGACSDLSPTPTPSS